MAKRKLCTQLIWLGIVALVAIIGILLLFFIENITGNVAMPKMTTEQLLQQADMNLKDAGALLKPGAKLLMQVQINKGVQALKKTEYYLKQAEKETGKIKQPTQAQKDANLLLKQTTNKVGSARTKITKAGTLGVANKQKKHKEGYAELQQAQEMLKKVRAVFK